MCRRYTTAYVGTVKGFPFVHCHYCHLVFCPVMDTAKSVALYESGYHGINDGAPQQGWADPAFLQPALARLDPATPLNILDFGAGQSLVPKRLRARGHRVLAIDVIPPSEPHPDRFTGDILTCALPEKEFDLIYSFQVFEHLPNPRPVLCKLLQLVKPDGYLFIHTDMETPERSPHRITAPFTAIAPLPFSWPQPRMNLWPVHRNLC